MGQSDNTSTYTEPESLANCQHTTLPPPPPPPGRPPAPPPPPPPGPDTIVRFNKLSDSRTGIRIDAGANPTIVSNTIHGNQNGVILSSSTSDPALSDNVFCGNNVNVLDLDSGPMEIEDFMLCDVEASPSN
jgi:parallel beta-helix repeat protein